MNYTKSLDMLTTILRGKVRAVIVFLLLLVLIFVFAPLSVIWALNTLFPVLAIPYTFWTWLSVVILDLTWFYNNSK